ncbi:sugar ABC transporter permease [Ideonella sp. DXS22W]|jgi:multiple sugar transport system permease protein|uniref:Sugar ABC transporter permease n=1 Tax=Pseudaquabacterium inlustre TaxID=2984192 RepID=A0ABU9CDX2_9BURK
MAEPLTARAGAPAGLRWRLAWPLTVGHALVAPAGALMLLLLFGPLAVVAALSLSDYQFGADTLAYVGLDNYRALAGDRVFWKSLSNTALYSLAVVPCSAGLGLLAALGIHGLRRGQALYRAALFLPVMATLIAMAIVWEFMLHPNFGLVNLWLKALGGTPRAWLQDESLALWVLAVIGVWQGFGFNMVLFSAGLLGIPRALYEAAEVDGVPAGWARFRLVTWPMLAPVTLFVLVISAIKSFQVFDTVHVLTKGGPNKATEVLVYTLYAEGFEFFRSGHAAAVTMVFLAIVLLITVIKTRWLDKRVHYA